ncbi:hypothetical protein GKE82_05585 [Conexibacter sp. W3-3-2]|uniref:hypothetical protein n=1 Tax=Conexibacter sp. W3-3-2 TaxID=2675227 RepID=UPI0012B854A0|nr:hypothetical protein [Conexibacter sp. W3-3-2]MTD43791.1 hypothetical protein [Conexibacter sp. W3-3-2]
MSPSPPWYPRFGDIPGIDWPCPPGIDRRTLRGHDARPQENDWGSDSTWWPIIYERDRDDRASVGLTWSVDTSGRRDDDDFDDDGSTGSSPASQYPGFTGPRSVDEELQRMYEALELPGTAADYEHRISAAASYLHKIRLREANAIAESERLCLLSFALVRACPEILNRKERYPDEDNMPVWMATAHLLTRIYEDNGDLAEAERAAVTAAEEFGQRVDHALSRIRERLSVLRAEHA